MPDGDPIDPPKRGLFFRFRVALLLIVLAGTLLYAWKDIDRRHKRTEWKRPLVIAFVVVLDGPVSSEAVRALERRVPALEARLHEEMARYRDASIRPFAISVFGPATGAGRSVPPASLDDLAVGRKTAEEIGWAR